MLHINGSGVLSVKELRERRGGGAGERGEGVLDSSKRPGRADRVAQSAPLHREKASALLHFTPLLFIQPALDCKWIFVSPLKTFCAIFFPCVIRAERQLKSLAFGGDLVRDKSFFLITWSHASVHRGVSAVSGGLSECRR